MRPVAVGGWDNRTFRLGDELSCGCPARGGYVAQVEKEHRWLPVLAPHLPLPIPAPLARGQPGEGTRSPGRSTAGSRRDRRARTHRRPGAVRRRRWPGSSRAAARRPGRRAGRRAAQLLPGGAARRLRRRDPAAIAALGDAIDAGTATAIWDAALAADLDRPAGLGPRRRRRRATCWSRDGRLAAVIDFGSSGVGDPACDLVHRLDVLRGDEPRRRSAPRSTVDAATWARGRGWALWKALITVTDRVTRPASRPRCSGPGPDGGAGRGRVNHHGRCEADRGRRHHERTGLAGSARFRATGGAVRRSPASSRNSARSSAVASARRLGGARRARAASSPSDARHGDSIAVNGVCLTVVDDVDGDLHRRRDGRDAASAPSLGALAAGRPVNLERAAAVGTRLGGHIVQGHVDGVGHDARPRARRRSGRCCASRCRPSWPGTWWRRARSPSTASR